ncbi:MAG: hypothetical protein JST68_05635 [Bacteroidetes bacterium]|nr:hypothetical protein [Bacteroidota bacterium]
MYDLKPNLIIGFHGCDRSVRDQLLMNPNDYKISKKPYDWLGHGLYFWENNYDRALEWANDKLRRGGIKEPSVVGATLSLGHCCDFLDKRYIDLLAYHFEIMNFEYECNDRQLPQNKDLKHDLHKDRVLRELDCAVIEYMHSKILNDFKQERSEAGFSPYKIFDSTRGVFTEGGPAFPNAGIFSKNHIQICIRNPNCIQGFFLPRHEIDFEAWLERKAS